MQNVITAKHDASNIKVPRTGLLTCSCVKSLALPAFADMLSKLMGQGCGVLDACQVTINDPKLLAWLHEPQLMQKDEKEIETYSLQVCWLLLSHTSDLVIPVCSDVCDHLQQAH